MRIVIPEFNNRSHKNADWSIGPPLSRMLPYPSAPQLQEKSDQSSEGRLFFQTAPQIVPTLFHGQKWNMASFHSGIDIPSERLGLDLYKTSDAASKVIAPKTRPAPTELSGADKVARPAYSQLRHCPQRVNYTQRP